MKQYIQFLTLTEHKTEKKTLTEKFASKLQLRWF